MDCPSEERMVRMKLEGLAKIQSLNFDLPNRRLEVYHTGSHDDILAALETLRLDTGLVSSEETETALSKENPVEQRKALWQVLAINLFFFVFEVIAGFIAGSMGLVADSLDMLADSIVYGLSLFAVAASVSRKKTIAATAGYFQMALAVLGFMEVIRRFAGYGETPDFRLMIIISFLALSGNAICLYLLQKSQSREAHMQASMIFTSNDVIINICVIAAGVLVFVTRSGIPDLITGAIVFLIVARGSFRILQIAKQ
jgi:Co/Zn/Cd efflux system component